MTAWHERGRSFAKRHSEEDVINAKRVQVHHQLVKCSRGSADMLKNTSMKSNVMLVPVASRHECHDSASVNFPSCGRSWCLFWYCGSPGVMTDLRPEKT